MTLSPDLYGHGMSHILPIYSVFESSIFRASSSSSQDPHLAIILRSLHIDDLERTGRLQEDLALFGFPPPHGDAMLVDNRLYPPRLRSFLSHISTSTGAKPHILIAYTWVLYMALFSGGRYLRSQLRTANTEAWHIGPSPDIDPDAPLQFWCFAGDQDGEDLKTDFKARIKSLETLLTPEERREVVDEGIEIMKRMIAVVQEIATTAAETETQEPDHQSTVTSLLTMRLLLPFSLLKTLASWSWDLATGRRVGLGAVGRRAVA